MSCSRWQGLRARAKLTFCGVPLDSSIKLNEGERQQLVQSGSGLHLWGLQGQAGCHLRGPAWPSSRMENEPLGFHQINPALSMALVSTPPFKKKLQIIPFQANLPELETPNHWDCHSSPLMFWLQGWGGWSPPPEHQPGSFFSSQERICSCSTLKNSSSATTNPHQH